MNHSFWLLKEPPTQRLAQEASDSKFETIICPLHAGHQRAGRLIGGLSIIVDPAGVKDFVWTWTNDILISPRVLDLFNKHHVTGFEVRSAKVSYSKTTKARPPNLFELLVTGWGGWAAPAAGVRLVESCAACGDQTYTIAEPSRLIDDAAWDGSDLFIVWPLPGYRFVSDRLANIIRQQGLSGVNLISAQRLPVRRGARVGPGLLTDSMPAPRAREIGQRYGIR
jgi:Protein of unknown function (Gmx_para_CXXCG)